MLSHTKISQAIKIAHNNANNNNKLNHTKIKDNICNSVDHIFKLLPKFTQYTNTISSDLIHNTSTFVKHLFTIKSTTKLSSTVTLRIYPLKKTNIFSSSHMEYIIPSYLDIFSQLLNNKEWLNTTTFTSEEILELATLFSNSQDKDKTGNKTGDKTGNGNDNSNGNKINDIYTYLDTHKVGNKLGDVFYSSLVNNKLPTTILEQYPSIKLHRLLINDFTSWSIIANIESTMTHVAIVSFTYEGTEYANSIYIFINEHTTTSSIANITKLAKAIVHRIIFYNKLLNTSRVPQRFILYLTDLEKEFDNSVIAHKHFKTQNINSAVTNKQDIVIYRKQELFKSIFHELNHFHTMDFTTIPPTVLKHLIKTHNIARTNTYLLYECVTEALANVLNNIYLSRTILDFKSNFAKELRFSTMQVAKILSISNYTKWNDFAGNSMHIDARKHFKQDSCVFSYYILKWYILLAFPTYIVKCLDANTLKFNVNSHAHTAFNNLIKIFDAGRTNPLLSETIDIILQLINTNKKTSNKRAAKRAAKKIVNKGTIGNITMQRRATTLKLKEKQKLFSTLRMTCL
uniref:Uncharacterized protein n=1 Tax=viral metagenome TaxID=1070528 RepID=A0A6C0HMJ9_9ZZZZ